MAAWVGAAVGINVGKTGVGTPIGDVGVGTGMGLGVAMETTGVRIGVGEATGTGVVAGVGVGDICVECAAGVTVGNGPEVGVGTGEAGVGSTGGVAFGLAVDRTSAKTESLDTGAEKTLVTISNEVKRSLQ